MPERKQPRVRVRKKPQAAAQEPAKPLTLSDRLSLPFVRGGPAHASFVRVGLRNANATAGYAVPQEDGTRVAYVQRKEGVREYVGVFSGYVAAHRAIIAAHHTRGARRPS